MICWGEFPEERKMSRMHHVSWLVLAIALSIVPPASADTYYAYSQGGIPPGTDIYTWCDTGTCDVYTEVACETPEGGASLVSNSNAYIGWGVFFPFPHPANSVDLTAFETGDIRFWIKAPADGSGNPYGNVKIEIQCDGSGTTVQQNLIDNGWDSLDAGSWQEITIPVCDFFEGGVCDTTCLSAITSPFLATLENLPFFNSFSVDYVRWQTPNTHAGASSVEISGRQLIVNGEPFVVNGMAYAPVAPCENWQNAWYDRADRYTVDFPLIAASGANTVRLYAPLVSTAMLDEAWANGLYVIPTFNPDPDQITCPAGRDFLRDRFVEFVEDWGDHPAILLWLVGNEFNAGLTSTELCDNWYPQLDVMAAAAHAAEGASSHPVGTANSLSSDLLPEICDPGCSDDTTLPNVDFWAVQSYRGCSFDSIFTNYGAKDYCARPLIVTEFGVDAWDSAVDVVDEVMQADCLESLLDEAEQAQAVHTPGGVSSGQVIFSWADEWWKSETECGDPLTPTDWCVQDTCDDWTNSLYAPDADIYVNEEWWGMVSLDGADPALRTTRTAYDRVGDSWNLGDVCNLEVALYNASIDQATISFDPAPGSTDHTLYYGPLGAVSTYGFSGMVQDGLDATGSGTVTLPTGSLFWVVVGRNNGEEGSYGMGDTERPPYAGAPVPQDPYRTYLCSTP
jgi:hypothetical protein